MIIDQDVPGCASSFKLACPQRGPIAERQVVLNGMLGFHAVDERASDARIVEFRLSCVNAWEWTPHLGHLLVLGEIKRGRAVHARMFIKLLDCIRHRLCSCSYCKFVLMPFFNQYCSTRSRSGTTPRPQLRLVSRLHRKTSTTVVDSSLAQQRNARSLRFPTETNRQLTRASAIALDTYDTGDFKPSSVTVIGAIIRCSETWPLVCRGDHTMHSRWKGFISIQPSSSGINTMVIASVANFLLYIHICADCALKSGSAGC